MLTEAILQKGGLLLRFPHGLLLEDEFFELCREIRFEYKANGEVIALPPLGLLDSTRNARVNSQLGQWQQKCPSEWIPKSMKNPFACGQK